MIINSSYPPPTEQLLRTPPSRSISIFISTFSINAAELFIYLYSGPRPRSGLHHHILRRRRKYLFIYYPNWVTFARQWQFILTQKVTSQMFRHPRHLATHNNNTTTVFLSILKRRHGRLGSNSYC